MSFRFTGCCSWWNPDGMPWPRPDRPELPVCGGNAGGTPAAPGLSSPIRCGDSSLATIYRVPVSSSLSPGEIRAAAETHDELGPAYRDAVIESFLDKVGREIDARVDARLAQQQAAQPPVQDRRGHSGSPMVLAIISMALGIPTSVIFIAATRLTQTTTLLGLLVVWIAITAINIAYNVSYAAVRQPADRR
jgi:hypothetical protein